MSLSARRAWIEILFCAVFSSGAKASLSARRAWIEIQKLLKKVLTSTVALRKESVDRNTSKDKNTMQVPWSLSARRAWIEMAAVIYS